MTLAIVGAGMTGAYLYRLLKNEGVEAALYERDPPPGCGLKPCAWGTSAGFFPLVARAGLSGEDYLLRRFDHLFMDGVRLKADLFTFDKPRLIKDLLGSARVLRDPVPVAEYRRVIDATGVSRALLPPVGDDIVLRCRQYLVESGTELENRIKLGGIGYAWCFPLAPGRYHIGCGSLIGDPQATLEGLGWLNGGNPGEQRIVCGCSGAIRLTGPRSSLPFVAGGCREGIWGVGEAVGCVAPLAGDGIVPGLLSVRLLLENWDDPKRYAEAVCDEFGWMNGERAIVDRLRRGEGMGLRDAAVLKKNARRMGIKVGVRQALDLLKSLR